MRNLIIVMIVSVFLAYCSQYNGIGVCKSGEKQRWDIYLIILIIIMSLFIGLRTSYNDTTAYIRSFNRSETIQLFLSNPENLDIFHNPLYYAIVSLFRTFTDNYHIYFMAFAFFNTTLFVRFIQRYTVDGYFPFAIFLFFAFGTFTFSMAAMKQVTAMAILTLALNALIEKKYYKYYFIVIIAILIHTYAIGYLILPLFYTNVWNYRGTLLLLGTLTIMMTFQSSISSLLEIADSAGKTVTSGEVFDGKRMNVFRVAVYAVIPLLTFLFKHKLSSRMSDHYKLFGNMSIISLMFMLLALMNGANMFGRFANYFVLGSICILPRIIVELFQLQSAKVIKFIAIVCFSIFFVYENLNFDETYQTMSLIEFIDTLF
ncbi:EpsG family protein [Thomasclavelia cocleata]|uniref:EpsG family protein n=1 Tax=Thomasclavelia cocleata TaxID=69824 RepID=UPI0024300439|nr:EpsG family protein [Thomasclavelia cocleata]